MKELKLQPGYGTKERHSKNVFLSAKNVKALKDMAPPRCRTAAVNLSVELLHALVTGNPPELDEFGERLEAALPDTMDAYELGVNLRDLAYAVERAGLQRETAGEEERELEV